MVLENGTRVDQPLHQTFADAVVRLDRSEVLAAVFSKRRVDEIVLQRKDRGNLKSIA